MPGTIETKQASLIQIVESETQENQEEQKFRKLPCILSTIYPASLGILSSLAAFYIINTSLGKHTENHSINTRSDMIMGGFLITYTIGASIGHATHSYIDNFLEKIFNPKSRKPNKNPSQNSS